MHINTFLWKLCSSSVGVNHLISKELHQKQNGFKFIYEILVALNENWLSLWIGHFFHPYDVVLISELSKRSRLYHFNVLKCNFYFKYLIKVWIIFRTISVFKPSQCCRGDIYCFSLNSKKTSIIDLLILTVTWLPSGQLWATEGAASLNQY